MTESNINIAKLLPGMRTAEDIHSKYGAIGKGSILRKEDIEIIKNNGYFNVRVLIDDGPLFIDKEASQINTSNNLESNYIYQGQLNDVKKLSFLALLSPKLIVN